MKKHRSIHRIIELDGPPQRCGEEYGRRCAESIEAFLHMEATPNPKRLRFAGRCWEKLRRWEKPVVEFVRGMAAGSGLSIEEVTLLLLHEELVHMKACTAIGARGEATRDGSAIIGQNWDWHSRLYPWSQLVRMRIRGAPATLTYGYPGLWAAAGINEHGLSLVWTSAVCIPKVRAIVGIPTYALIAGILTQRNCREAITLLRRTTNAGCFIFFLADAEGEVWVVEGLPVKSCPFAARMSSAARTIIKVRRRAIYRTSKARSQVWRAGHFRARIAQLARRRRGKVDANMIEQFLSDESGKTGQRICQSASAASRNMTLDSLCLVPSKREMWIARGLPTRHEFARYRV